MVNEIDVIFIAHSAYLDETAHKEPSYLDLHCLHSVFIFNYSAESPIRKNEWVQIQDKTICFRNPGVKLLTLSLP